MEVDWLEGNLQSQPGNAFTPADEGTQGRTILSNPASASPLPASPPPETPSGSTAAWAPSESQLQAGVKCGNYLLESSLGEGGMGSVWKAKEVHLDRYVALKILPPLLAKNPEHVKRFENEARSAARLDHPNVTRVFGSGFENGLFYIALEYVEGITLKQRLEQQGKPLPVPEVLHYTAQVASALAHMEDRKLTHRDIKPSNIILMNDSQVKLVDLGLARLGDFDEQGLTRSGATLGTFDYIAPEQALDPRKADSRSDIYSLGCTIYHLLTGVAPVPEGTPARKLSAHQHEKPADPRTYQPEIPEKVVQLLANMMAKLPEDRPASAAALVAQLKLMEAKSTTQPYDTPEVEETVTAKPWLLPVSLMLLVAAIIGWSQFLTPPNVPVTSNPSATIAQLNPTQPTAPDTSVTKLDTYTLRKIVETVGQLSNGIVNIRKIAGEVTSNSKSTEKSSGPRKVFVDGLGQKADSYNTLAEAVEQFGPQEEGVIELKSDVKINSQLRIGNKNLSIRSFGDSQHKLECDSSAVSSFFEVSKGELHFDSIHLHYKSGESCVALCSEGKCRFHYCLVTQDQAENALVQIQASKEGTSKAANNPTRCEWERTLVRGGQLLKVISPRPLEVSLIKCGLALQGYLLSDSVQTPQDSTVDISNLTLQHTTVYSGKGLAKMAYGVKMGVADQYRWNVTDCILHCDAGAHLIRLDGAQTELDLQRRLLWQGTRNVFCVSGSYLEWKPSEMADMAQQYDARRWSELWGRGDDSALHLRELLMEGVGNREKSLVTVQPKDFTPKRMDPQLSDVTDRGVQVNLLPSE